VFAGIAPHPPIMVPEVGRDACVDVQDSISAMAELTERLVRSRAETVVIISPHAPLEPAAFIAYEGPHLYGDFANFRAPTATIHAEVDEEMLNAITHAAGEEDLAVIRIKGYDLDHGTAVPLYFLQRNGWQGRVIALGYSFRSNEDHLRFGKCIRKAIERVGRSAAFIASGDLSHRLRRDAPAGYEPDAHLFDEEVVDAIRANSTIRIINIDHALRHVAGECGYRSMLVAIGVAQASDSSCEVINYEAPFGVGYLVAQLVSEATGLGSFSPATGARANAGNDPATDPLEGTALSRALPALARQTVETFIHDGTVITRPDNLPAAFQARAGCFVSIKTRDGHLRGCIGTIDPLTDTLAEEIIANAINAATRDPRFSPVLQEELPGLRYSVDVLSTPEPTRLADLDPRIHGVIVEDQSGLHRGLLLPNLRGVDTAAKQVEIASRKAGLTPDTPVKLYRFRAERYSE